MTAKEFGSLIAKGTNPVAGLFKSIELMRQEQEIVALQKSVCFFRYG